MVLVRAKDLRHPHQGFAPRRGALDTLELLFQADREIGVVILPFEPDRTLLFGVNYPEPPLRPAHRQRICLAPLWRNAGDPHLSPPPHTTAEHAAGNTAGMQLITQG